MGTPEFAVPALEELNKKYEILSVYTQPDRPKGRGLSLQYPPVKVKALELGLSVEQPDRLSSAKEIEKIKNLKPDLIVVAAYGQILKQEILDIPRFGCINIHSSLLPRWRGAAPIHWALLAGDLVTGITIMKMALKLDAGNILLQREIQISKTDTYISLHDRLSQLGGELVVQALQLVSDQKITEKIQDESLATYAKKLTKEMSEMDPSESIFEIDLKIRALNPWPGAYVQIEGLGSLKILTSDEPDQGKKGNNQLVSDSGNLFLLTKTGCLKLTEIQLPGKPKMKPVDFINGLKGRSITLPLDILKWPKKT